MQLIHAPSRQLTVMVLIAIVFVFAGYYHVPASRAQASQIQGAPASAWTPEAALDGFVYHYEADRAVCRPATAEEFQSIQERHVAVRAIGRGGITTQDAGDVNISLRGTPQLDNFPQAKAVFLHAADIWKSKIQTMGPAITIVIDVDFGPTRFGTAWGAGVLGSTGSQQLGNSQGYSDVRNALVTRASSPSEAALFATLPVSNVPTDIGTTTGFVTPAALLRALGILNPVADPATETQFGSPPSIGFNSNFQYDFDPSDGIGPTLIDFESVAVHEIGHALGFSSRVGATELNPGITPSVSVLDLFRFRPGTTSGMFGSSQRILSSGGSQMFFADSPDLGLSTGRPDGSGGDGSQASHWKDSILTCFQIGVMDPAIARGERSVITNNDLTAFDALGYQLKPFNSPAFKSTSGSLQGDVVTLAGKLEDAQGDVVQAQTTLLDDSCNVLLLNPPVAVDFGGQTSANFNLQIAGLNSRPTATHASLAFTDSQTNRSVTLEIDFTLADPGGPAANKANYGTKLVIKGGGLSGLLQIEVNGVIVTEKDNGSDGKAKIKGSETKLNLHAGANRVRVIKNGLRSNCAIATL